MAVNSKTPAFIDPPYYGDLTEWLAYREELLRSDLPGLAPFIREADVNIARLRQPR
jgi:hypothetical protein